MLRHWASVPERGGQPSPAVALTLTRPITQHDQTPASRWAFLAGSRARLTLRPRRVRTHGAGEQRLCSEALRAGLASLPLMTRTGPAAAIRVGLTRHTPLRPPTPNARATGSTTPAARPTPRQWRGRRRTTTQRARYGQGGCRNTASAYRGHASACCLRWCSGPPRCASPASESLAYKPPHAIRRHPRTPCAAQAHVCVG